MDRVGNEKMGAMDINIPVAASTKITEAHMVAINADGYAVEASKAADIKVAGCAIKYTENEGADGEKMVLVRRGAFVWNNDGTIENTDILKDCYVSDAQTVTITPEGSSKAGVILAVEADGVTVEML